MGWQVHIYGNLKLLDFEFSHLTASADDEDAALDRLAENVRLGRDLVQDLAADHACRADHP